MEFVTAFTSKLETLWKGSIIEGNWDALKNLKSYKNTRIPW